MMWVLHVVAFFYYMPALFVTIPLHLLINAIEESKN